MTGRPLKLGRRTQRERAAQHRGHYQPKTRLKALLVDAKTNVAGIVGLALLTDGICAVDDRT